MMTTSRREDLILAHMPQVELLARRLHRRCPRLELDDLISAGTIGLIQAVDRFDPSRNLKLKTLADHRIRGAMLDYLRQIDPLPRNARRFQKRRDAVMAEFAKVGETPTYEQIAEALGVSMRRFVSFSVMITASETLSIAESPCLKRRLTG
jgi:RNA polymerase sigma factor for flagellar operon FliA